MLIINDKDIKESLGIMKHGAACCELVSCLLDGKEYKMCGNCHFHDSDFLKKFKSDSPGFYSLMLTLTDADKAFREAMLKDILESNEEILRAREKLFLLVDLAPAILLGLYPLFMANGRSFPILSWKEMKKEDELFRKASMQDFEEIAKKIKNINEQWRGELLSAASKLSNAVANTKIILWLIKIFVQKIEKEDEKMFEAIDCFLASNTRQAV